MFFQLLLADQKPDCRFFWNTQISTDEKVGNFIYGSGLSSGYLFIEIDSIKGMKKSLVKFKIPECMVEYRACTEIVGIMDFMCEGLDLVLFFGIEKMGRGGFSPLSLTKGSGLKFVLQP